MKGVAYTAALQKYFGIVLPKRSAIPQLRTLACTQRWDLACKFCGVGPFMFEGKMSELITIVNYNLGSTSSAYWRRPSLSSR